GVPHARTVGTEGLDDDHGHDDVRRRGDVLQARRHRRRRRHAPDRPVRRPRRQPRRHGRHVLGGRVRGDRRPGDEEPPRRPVPRDQVPLPDGRRAQRRWRVAPAHRQERRGQPAAPRRAAHRPLPDARLGRRDAAGGDARGARHAHQQGQDPLHRLLELLGLAHHEGTRGVRARRVPALRLPADPLHAAGPRGRERAGPGVGRPGPRHPRVEPDRRRPALGQVPPRAGRPRDLAPPRRVVGAARPRPRASLRHHRGRRRDRRRPRRLRRAGGQRVAAAPARRHLAGDRRPDRGAADRQPRRRRARADRRRGRPPRRGLGDAAALPVLAPEEHDHRPALAGGRDAAGPL
ncbi:MAG: Aldo/keto reductase, SMc04322 family, partial [uncultured Actinomycetospora sp.]